MTKAETKGSGLAAVIMALVPVAAAIVACGGMWLASGDTEGLEAAGGGAVAVLGCGGLGAIAASLLLFFTARGRRVAVAWPIVFAAAPFVAGEVGRLVIAAGLEESVAAGGAGTAAMLVAGAVERSTAVTFLGGVLGSALCASVGIGFVVATLGPVGSSRSRQVTGAVAALGVSAVAAAVAAHAAALREGFGAVVSAGPTGRGGIALALAEEVASFQQVGVGAGLAVAVAVAAGCVWAVWRSDRRGRSIAAALALVTVSVTLAALDTAVTARTAPAFAAGARSEWDVVAGFEPIAFAGRGACPQPLDFIVGGDGDGASVVVPGGSAVSVHARELSAFIQSSAYIDPSDPWAPPLSVAVDRRVGASDLNGFMEGARAAGARAVCVAGTGLGLDGDERERLAELEPMLAPFAASVGGVELDLAAADVAALEATLAGREPVALAESVRF